MKILIVIFTFKNSPEPMDWVYVLPQAIVPGPRNPVK